VIGDIKAGMKANIKSFEDLEVYQKLCELHLEICKLTLSFPRFELYELGSQIRRSSNSISANIAEGWNNRHINIYLEGINRSLGELQETKHHLYMAFRKDYLNETVYNEFLDKYNECGKMLKGLQQSLLRWKTRA
jgi:four helix bundle protein